MENNNSVMKQNSIDSSFNNRIEEEYKKAQDKDFKGTQEEYCEFRDFIKINNF